MNVESKIHFHFSHLFLTSEVEDVMRKSMEEMFLSFHSFNSQSLAVLERLLNERNNPFLPQLLSFLNEARKNVKEREEKQRQFLARTRSTSASNSPMEEEHDRSTPSVELQTNLMQHKETSLPERNVNAVINRIPEMRSNDLIKR